MLRFTAVPHTRLQALNARTMHQALQETAQATLHTDADAGPLVAFREEQQVLGRQRGEQGEADRAAALDQPGSQGIDERGEPRLEFMHGEFHP